MITQEDQNWVMFCHLGGIVHASFLNILIPLAIWLLKRDGSLYLYDQGREIINFQISLYIYILVLSLVMFTIVGMSFALLGIAGLVIFGIISSICGAITAAQGGIFLYPLNLRLIK